MTELLVARALCKSYRSFSLLGTTSPKTVLSDVSLSIGEGESVALLGRSGSGKSTMGRLMLGLEQPDSGDILFRGVSLPTMNAQAQRVFRQSVQVVFQDSIGAVNPRHTIGSIIAEPLRHLTDLDDTQQREKIAKLLVQVGLSPSDARKYPAQMSGGQLQRACIARALAPGPRLLILDEALSNLDLVLQMQIIALLRTLQESTGIAFLFITHDLRLVRLFCRRVVVLDDGHLAEEALVGQNLNLTSPEGAALQRAMLPALPARANTLV